MTTIQGHRIGCDWPRAGFDESFKCSQTSGAPISTSTTVSFNDVQNAAVRIAPWAHRTTVLTCESVNQRLGINVFFKCENFQKSGAFKFRGAVNSVAQLSPDELKRGVVTHSSGNHAGALAAAAKIFGTKAFIVMPKNSSKIKQAAVRSYGGVITECEPTTESRVATAQQVQSETGSILIPPFDHAHVIAGQGTCAMEFLEQVPQLDTILAPIGGGGLMAGTCLAARQIMPELKIWGAEPTGADDAFRSKAAGRLIPLDKANTIADGLRTGLGNLTWPFVRDDVDEILTADDDAITKAMRFFWERTKVIIEPSSAVPLAGLFNRQSANLPSADSHQPKNVGLIISGGNVDFSHLPWH